MAVRQIIIHIIPLTASAEKCANLLSTEEIDIPEQVSTSSFTDPRSCIQYDVRTTICKEHQVSNEADIDNILYKKCESIPSLVCLKKYNRDLPPSSEVCIQSGALDHHLPFSLAIPYKIARPENFACALGHPLDTNAPSTQCGSTSNQSDSCRKSLNLSVTNGDNVEEWTSSKNAFSSNSVLKELLSSNSEMVKDGYKNCSSIQDLLEPLEKHFVDNKCLLCGFVSVSKQRHSGKRHMITHLTSRNFKCDLCDKTFKTPGYLYSHKEGCHSNKSTRAASVSTCNICDKTFSRKKSFKNHMRSHYNSESHFCPICNHKFSSAKQLKIHRTIHTGEKPYECHTCNKKFRTSKSLYTHKTTHIEVNSLLSCTVCDKKFRDQKHLKTHMNKHAEPKFKCEFCDKAFRFHSNMLQHKLAHSDLRRHSCETCGMKFKFPHHLKNHIATHDL